MKTTIYRARIDKGMTQTELAYKANIGISGLSPIEKGRACTMRVFMAICKVLEIDPKDVEGVTIKKRVGKHGWQIVEGPFDVSAELERTPR